ncbi:MAG: iron ABC transporter permease [Acetatifactor sp.]|nr:iron ABC transporter permease [Acetatifactor sp.]
MQKNNLRSHAFHTGCTFPSKYLLAAALLAASALSLLSLMTGRYPLTLGLLLKGDTQAVRVFVTLRLPRTGMALLGGFGLGIAGYVFQTVFRNPLASPDMIGVSSGASAGAAFGILFLSSGAFSGALSITASAFAGGLLAVFLTLALGSLAPQKGGASIVLAGVAVHSLAQTFLMILKLLADPEKELSSIEYWLMGSLGAVTLRRLPVSLILGLCSIVGLCLLHRQILLLSLEESESRMLGVPVERLRFAVLLLATLLTASIISNTGLISFIGLLAPHTARLLARDNRFPTFLLSGLWGSILLLAADILARSAGAGELPVSIFTSLLGAPFLIYLVVRSDRP